MVPTHKESKRSKFAEDIEIHLSEAEFYEPLHPPTKVYEAEARSIRSSGVKIVEIGPSKHEWATSKIGEIVELADTSRRSVKEWARRSMWSVRSSRLKGYEERSWFEPGSPGFVRSPVKGRFDEGPPSPAFVRSPVKGTFD